MSDVIQDPTLRAFVHSKVNNEFELDIDTVANGCKNHGRFSAWLNSDINLIKEVLQIVKNAGVSPAFFASYEMTEGYNSSWGWLNHTTPDGTPKEDALSVSNWIVQQSNNMSDNPAWIDYANYNDFVPEEVKQAGNQDFENMIIGSIGRVVIAGTAAATWEVYYPLGLLEEYNGVQDYSAPLGVMIDVIEQWGGVIDDNPPDPPDPPNPPDPPDYTEAIQKIMEIFTNDVYQYGNEFTYGNSFLTLIKQLGNTFKLQPTEFLHEYLNDLFGDVPIPDPDPDPDPDKPFPPVENYENITAVYGYSDGYDGWHAGLDFGAKVAGVDGDNIYATMEGVVRVSGWNDGGLGNVIWLEHDEDNYFSAYAHLSGFNVDVGDNVSKGDVIGYMGNTGLSFGTHLHFVIATELWGNQESTTIDPEIYLGI